MTTENIKINDLILFSLTDYHGWEIIHYAVTDVGSAYAVRHNGKVVFEAVSLKCAKDEIDRTLSEASHPLPARDFTAI